MILGESGSGKSTLLHLIGNLYRDYTGEILLLDECTSHLDAETSRHIEETIFGLENRMVVYVAHNATEYAYEAADEVLCVRNGVIEKLTNEERNS